MIDDKLQEPLSFQDLLEARLTYGISPEYSDISLQQALHGLTPDDTFGILTTKRLGQEGEYDPDVQRKLRVDLGSIPTCWPITLSAHCRDSLYPMVIARYITRRQIDKAGLRLALPHWLFGTLVHVDLLDLEGGVLASIDGVTPAKIRALYSELYGRPFLFAEGPRSWFQALIWESHNLDGIKTSLGIKGKKFKIE